MARGRAYLSQGQTHRPQHLERSVRFFSACLMSWLIWSMPSSTRFSCSATHAAQRRHAPPARSLREEGRRRGALPPCCSSITMVLAPVCLLWKWKRRPDVSKGLSK